MHLNPYMGPVFEACQVQRGARRDGNVLESDGGAAGLLLDGARGVGEGASAARSDAR